MISSDWIDLWKAFIINSKPPPPGINNTILRKRIERRRKELNDPVSDDDLGITKQKDYYEFDYKLWKFYYDSYGCSDCI